MNRERTSANENVLFVIPCHNVTMWMNVTFPLLEGIFLLCFMRTYASCYFVFHNLWIHACTCARRNFERSFDVLVFTFAVIRQDFCDCHVDKINVRAPALASIELFQINAGIAPNNVVLNNCDCKPTTLIH